MTILMNKMTLLRAKAITKEMGEDGFVEHLNGEGVVFHYKGYRLYVREQSFRNICMKPSHFIVKMIDLITCNQIPFLGFGKNDLFVNDIRGPYRISYKDIKDMRW